MSAVLWVLLCLLSPVLVEVSSEDDDVTEVSSGVDEDTATVIASATVAATATVVDKDLKVSVGEREEVNTHPSLCPVPFRLLFTTLLPLFCLPPPVPARMCPYLRT